MAKFEFKENRTVHLDIAGRVFDLPYNGDLLVRLRETGLSLQKYVADPEAEADGSEDLACFIYDQIDTVLGAGASDSIFANRAPDAVEASEVYGYITDEINNVLKNHHTRRTQVPVAVQAKPHGKHYKGKHR